MLEIHSTIDGFRAELDQRRAEGDTVGFVPTMGYLHDGHASLMRRAAADNDLAVGSIFVNPLQFAASEDLSDYPRDLARDVEMSAEAGVTQLLVPDVTEMYPEPIRTTVTVSGLTARYEGASRPEHFAGVATVVAKLFSIVGPCRAYFGEKDFQQLAVVRRLALDLSMPVEVVGCPTGREDDGLARSSRNVYLDEDQRRSAPVLYRALSAAAAAAAGGETSAAVLEALVADAVAGEPEGELDYVALVDPDSLEPVTEVGAGARLLLAVFYGSTRLLDNIAVVPGT